MKPALPLLILLAACGPFPQVETAEPIAGLKTPPLLPSAALEVAAGQLTGEDPLAARAAALQARADALRAQ